MRNIHKAEWGEGPWQSEPDRKEWKAHGFDCLIVRSPSGALCGYVGVPESHPLYGISYNDDRMPSLRVHGGLTYSDRCQGHICHKSDEGGGHVWWLGFDCAHAFDYMPAMEAFVRREGMLGLSVQDVYRDIDYVTEEVESLALQLQPAQNMSYTPAVQ